MYVYIYEYLSITEMSERDDLRLKKTEIIIKILDLENMIINEKNEKLQIEKLDDKKRKSFLSKVSILEELKKVSEINLLQQSTYCCILCICIFVYVYIHFIYVRYMYVYTYLYM
jgi:hypothetical protein